MKSRKIIFIVGPTAVGKSKVALGLAQRLGGEIVSCDAMQVYKEIHIASNKPLRDDLQKIPHHLIDIVSVEEEFDVVTFNKLARQCIQEIHGRDHVPVVVGGSGLYMKVLLDGIFEGGERDKGLRKQLEARVLSEGNQVLYDQLKAFDPQAAEKIHPNNLKRIIRALEVCMGEKQPVSKLRKNREGLWGNYAITVFVLNREREILYQMIDARVEAMFKHGLVEEVVNLQSLSWSKTAQTIIGVPEVLGFLSGEYDLDRARYLMKRNTRHFAKRQLTWFRREKRLMWINMTAKDAVERIVNQMCEKILKG